MVRPNNLFGDCKTKAEMLEILKKAHLELPVLDTDYMPDDLCEKRRELEQLMLKYIWKWSKEAGQENEDDKNKNNSRG